MDADDSEGSHILWLAERVAAGKTATRNVIREDVSFHENAPLYPAGKQASALSETHHVRSIIIHGSLLGRPYDRPRRLTAAWLKKYKWMGSLDHEAEFKDLFARRVCLPGDAFFVASDEEVNEMYAKMAIRQSTFGAVDWRDEDALFKTVSPGYFQRHSEWTGLAQKAIDEKTNDADVRWGLLADLEQHPRKTTHMSPSGAMPTLLCKSTVYSWSVGRLLTGMEMFGTHGLDVFGMSGGDYNYPYSDILRALPHDKMKQLAGNSLNIPVTTAWVLYVLSNLVDWEAKMS